MNGWLHSADSETDTSWVLTENDETFELGVPRSQYARDYIQRVAQLVNTLAVVEDEDREQVIWHLLYTMYDVQYFRTRSATLTGTTLLSDAVAAFKAVQGMYAAAATSLEAPRAVLPSRRSGRANNFMKRVLAGPTTEGSYVLSVLVPVPPRVVPDEDSVLFEIDNEPYERAVTAGLYDGLASTRAAAVEAIDADRRVQPFLDRVGAGVSANLCEAIVALAGEEGAGLEASFAWAVDRPRPDPVSRITFESNLVPVLKEAATDMRLLMPEPDVLLCGVVTRLHRESNSGPGDITVAGIVVGDADQQMKHATINLAESDYDAAITAHGDGLEIRVSGLLVRRGTRAYLESASNFTVLPPS
jgi:hypothetical protein